MKEKINKNIKCIISSIFLSSLVNSGCMLSAPIKTYNKNNNLFSEINVRTGSELGVLEPKLSSEQRFVPIHDRDGGPERGGRHLSIDSKFEIACYKLGLYGSYGNKKTRLNIGADAKLSSSFPFHHNLKNGYPKENVKGDGLADIKLQNLPRPYESYAYGQFRRKDNVSLEPFIGIEQVVLGDFLVTFELGIPQSSFSYEKGHWRWNRFEAIERNSWEGTGIRYGLNFQKKLDYSETKGISMGYEQYDAKLGDNKTKINYYTLKLKANFK
jgi:hypothetical protein